MKNIFILLAAILFLNGCGGAEKQKELSYKEKYALQQKKYSSLSQDKQIELVKKDWWMIQYIINPSLPVQKAAMEKNPKALQYIEHPPKEIQQLSIDKLIGYNGFDLVLAKKISKFDEDMQIKAVTKAPQIIKYIYQPSIKVQLAAVRKNPYAICSIKNPSKEAVDLAVKLNPRVKQYIK